MRIVNLNNDKICVPKAEIGPRTFGLKVRRLSHCAIEEKRFGRFYLLLRTVLLLTLLNTASEAADGLRGQF